MKSHSWIVVAAALACAPACKERPKSEPTQAPASAETRGAVLVRVFLDAEQVGSATAADLESRPALASLLPAEARDAKSWRYVEALGPEAHLTVPKPGANYADHRMILYLDKDGTAGIGLEKPNSEAFAVFQTGIERVTVRVSAEDILGKGKQPPRPADLHLEGFGPERTLRPADFAKIPRAAPPGEDPGDVEGWSLRAVLESVAPLDDFARVELLDAKGRVVELTHAELTDASYFPFLKRNRRGRFRFHLYQGKRIQKNHKNVVLIRGTRSP